MLRSASPCCYESGEVSSLVKIHLVIGTYDEARLLIERPDDTGTLHSLV